MSNGNKKACKVLATLKQAITEILITVISSIIAEVIIRLIFS